ncbi:hypothetical protein SUGI_0352450 [Cryptomeria japonica]|nr:hypothetical protein SUGI_0352450 [Cryptomeria japonica]
MGLNYGRNCHCRQVIRQLRTGWADGPAYITQCPIQTGQSYTYNFTITGQRGTLFWHAHAHILWLRATVYGALVVLPKLNVPYPFPISHKEITLILDTFVLPVEQGKACLLSIMNAALNDELFFDVPSHRLKVVDVDAVCTKPFETKSVVIAPGQNTNVLLHGNKNPGRYFMASRPFMDAPVPVDNRTATTILHYQCTQFIFFLQHD